VAPDCFVGPASKKPELPVRFKKNLSVRPLKALAVLSVSSLSLVSALGIATSVPAHATEPPAAASAMTIAPNLSHFTLDNGLEVVVIPDHRAPVVTHMIWYKVGSADEPEGQSGIAHFLEHLMFKGTEANPDGAFSKLVADIGGQENAFTSYDYTAYFQRVAKEHLPLMMQMEADRMENLLLTDDVIGAERDVVLEERRMRIDSEPASRLSEAMNALTFVNHPYGSPIIGWQHEIEALNREAAMDFYDRFYTPNNAVLVVAGDVEADAVKALAAETYGKVERRAEPGKRTRPAEPPLSGDRRIALSDDRVRQESVSQTWIVPSQSSDLQGVPEALDVLAYILGGGATSRLHKSAVLDEKIALSAGSYYQSGGLEYGRMRIYGTPAEGYTTEDVENQVGKVVKDLIERGVTEEELKRAKHTMVAEAVYAQDSQMSLARIFGSALTTGETVSDVQGWPSRIQAVTAEDVQEAAKAYLSGQPVTGFLKKSPAVEAADGTPANSSEKL
jgi:zinc protease